MKKILLMFSFLTLMGWTYAQNLDPSVMASAGGIDATDIIMLDWTLGEMAVEVKFTESNMITEGYHQPRLTVSDYQVTILTNSSTHQDYRINVFPNPVSSTLNVQIDYLDDSEIMVNLYNTLGDQLMHPLQKSSFDSFEINLSDFPSGVYLLRFYKSNGEEIKIFRISKIK